MEVRGKRRFGLRRVGLCLSVLFMLFCGTVYLVVVRPAYLEDGAVRELAEEAYVHVEAEARWPEWVHEGLGWVGLEGPMVGTVVMIDLSLADREEEVKRIVEPLMWMKYVEGVVVVGGKMPVGFEDAFVGMGELTSLSLLGCEITEEQWERIVDCVGLRQLSLHGIKVEDGIIDGLLKLKDLRQLALMGVSLKEEDVRRLLGGLELDELVVGDPFPNLSSDEVKLGFDVDEIRKVFPGVKILVE